MTNQFARTVQQLEFRIAGSDVIVHDTAHERVHVINRTAAYILQSCDGRRSAAAIAGELSARTGAPSTRTLSDVERLLVRFAELKLIR